MIEYLKKMLNEGKTTDEICELFQNSINTIEREKRDKEKAAIDLVTTAVNFLKEFYPELVKEDDTKNVGDLAEAIISTLDGVSNLSITVKDLKTNLKENLDPSYKSLGKLKSKWVIDMKDMIDATKDSFGSVLADFLD